MSRYFGFLITSARQRVLPFVRAAAALRVDSHNRGLLSDFAALAEHQGGRLAMIKGRLR